MCRFFDKTGSRAALPPPSRSDSVAQYYDITESDLLFGLRIVGSQLVDRAIGQMSEMIVQVVQRVLVGAKPC